MRKFVTAALLAGSALVAAPSHAAITYYTSQAAFLAALGGTAPVVEDFDDTTLVPGLSILTTAGDVDTTAPDLFYDRLVPNTATTTFILPTGGWYAFGGFFDLAGPGGPGLGITVTTVLGGTLSTEVPNSTAGSFWGFISTSAFDYVVFTAGTQGGVAETYTLNDLTFAKAPTTAVPEPATWGMMIVGLGVAGMAMRRRATKVSFA